jgi:HEAT repeat protein
VGGAADPRRPDRIIDLATPISPKSRSVVTLDAEDRQAPAASESLVARVDDALVRIARGEERLDALLAFGDVGLRRIAQRFPGDLDVLRRDIDVLPPPSAHGPLLRTCIDLGPRVTPHLLELFDHGNAAIRFYVAFVFQELRDPQCMPRLAAACFDAETDVRTIAARVLETYSRSTGYEEAIAMVRRELANADVQRQLHATRACGTLRDIWAVPQLIDLLAHRERPMQEAALEALCTITGQQLGLKAQRWKTWYGEQGRRHRVEWLVATLEHKDVAVRRWGYDELRRITGQNIPYTPTGEPREREAGVRRWLEWWSRDGRAAMTQHGRS